MCLFLPAMLGNAAENALSEGVEFSGMTLAVTAPEGDPIPQLLEQYMGKMQDVSRYCTLRALSKDDAIQALADGEVSAVLELPENFIQGILNGANPDVTLLVDESRPVEALLTLWVGQSAADLLSAVQSGIYGVLEAYDSSGSLLSREQVVAGINLCYVNLTVNRQDFFATQPLRATGSLPVGLHYGLSLLIWLCFSLAPLFFPVFTSNRLSARRRLRSVGLGSTLCCLSDIAACTLILLPITLISLLFLVKHWGIALICAFTFSLFCAIFGSFCSLVTGSAARCGGLSFLLASVGLFLSGGILPPVLLPKTLQQLLWLSPVAWLRGIVAALLGYDIPTGIFYAIPMVTIGMAAGCCFLYRSRMNRQEVA